MGYASSSFDVQEEYLEVTLLFCAGREEREALLSGN